MKYTIIVTVYNKEKYLEKCLESVCNQTYKNYAIIIVNDGSIDNSEKIIKKYKEKNKNIEYYYKKNTGIADTRNFAIKKVKTDYFLFVDADDYIELDLLENIDKYNDYDILSFNALKLEEDNELVKKIEKKEFCGDGEEFFIQLTRDNSDFTVPWGYVYSTKYFRDNKFMYPKGKILEDYYLTPLIILKAKKVISIQYNGYYYVENNNSIVKSPRNKERITKTYIEYYTELNMKINEYNIKKHTKKAYKKYLADSLIWYGSLLEKEKQKEYIRKLNDKNMKIPNILKDILFKMGIFYEIRKIYRKIRKMD